MPNYATDGDQGFGGVNMRLDPAQLPSGLAASARNKRFQNAIAKTRPGVVLLPWSNKAEDDYTHQSYAENSIVRYSGKRAFVSSAGSITSQDVATGLTNGSFATDPGGWSSSATSNPRWDISGGAAVCSGTGSIENFQIDVGTVSGRDYLVTFEITAYTSGNVTPFIGGTSANPLISSNRLGEVGKFTRVIHAQGSDADKLKLQADANFVGTVDNVTITEPAQVQIRSPHCSNDAYTTQSSCESNGGTWVDACGPLSNPNFGPYFKRKAANPGGVYTPLNASGGLNATQWENLGSRVFKFGTVYGVGLFSDPNSTEYLLVATPTGVYAAKEGMLAFKLAGLVDAGGTVTFVQAFNQVIMFRGEQKAPYVMKNLAAGFVELVREDNTDVYDENDQGDGTDTIPNAENGIYFQNRLLIPHSRDLVACSDYLNVTRYQPVLSAFRINQGSADSLVALHKFDQTTIICFKESSIFMVKNVYGNLTDIILDSMTQAYGCCAAKSIVSVGRDVWFLSEKRGVCSLGISESGAVQGVDQPISEPIQPLIDRINWHHASKAVSAYANNRFYIAVPIDGSTTNNAVLIFDFLNQLWTGYDDGVNVQEWVEPHVWGRKRLCFVSTNGTVNLYDDTELGGIADETTDDNGAVSTVAITDEITTRGYNLQTPERKKWHAARVNVQTLDASFTAKAQVDGVEEKTTITTITPDRAKYDKPFYQADYTVSNVNDDFNVPYRQDYSVSMSNSDSIWLSKQVNGNWTDAANAVSTVKINPNHKQETTHKLRLKDEGRYSQIQIESSSGSTNITSVLVDGLLKENIMRKES
jgi:hypothetical protein